MSESHIQELSEKILPCNTNKPYAFVSYSKRDAEKVYTSILALQQSGCNIWVDKNMEARADQSWTRLAFDAIQNKNCVAVVFMISASSVISMPCFSETMYSQRGQLTLNRHRNTPIKMITVNVDSQWDPRRRHFSQWLYDISDRYNDDTLNSLSTADRTLLADLGQTLAPPEHFNIPTSGDIPIAFMNGIYGGEKEADRVTILPVESTGAILKNISETQDKPKPDREAEGPSASGPAREDASEPGPARERPPVSGPGQTAGSSPKAEPSRPVEDKEEKKPAKKRSVGGTIALVIIFLLILGGGGETVVYILPIILLIAAVVWLLRKKRS